MEDLNPNFQEQEVPMLAAPKPAGRFEKGIVGLFIGVHALLRWIIGLFLLSAVAIFSCLFCYFCAKAALKIKVEYIDKYLGI